MRKNFIKIYWPLMAVSLVLSACGNGQPSKKDAENIYNSNAERTYIKVTDLRCDPAEHGSFSCFVAYQKYRSKSGEQYFIDQVIESEESNFERQKGSLEFEQEDYERAIAGYKKTIALFKERIEKVQKRGSGEDLSDQEIHEFRPCLGPYSPSHRPSFNPQECIKKLEYEQSSQISQMKENIDSYEKELRDISQKLAGLEGEKRKAINQAKKSLSQDASYTEGGIVGRLIQNEQANFTKVDGNWETDAFAEIN